MKPTSCCCAIPACRPNSHIASSRKPDVLRVCRVYSVAHNGFKVAAELQKILDHRVLVLNSRLELSHILTLGPHACVLQSDTSKAKAAYQDFFALWKDADPDIPILKEAKAEYANLQ